MAKKLVIIIAAAIALIAAIVLGYFTLVGMPLRRVLSVEKADVVSIDIAKFNKAGLGEDGKDISESQRKMFFASDKDNSEFKKANDALFKLNLLQTTQPSDWQFGVGKTVTDTFYIVTINLKDGKSVRYAYFEKSPKVINTSDESFYKIGIFSKFDINSIVKPNDWHPASYYEQQESNS